MRNVALAREAARLWQPVVIGGGQTKGASVEEISTKASEDRP
jgi:hypothetical protein